MVVHGQKGDATVAALPARDEDLHLKGDGKYEASVVVGVLTDQVDAPGGTSQALGFGAVGCRPQLGGFFLGVGVIEILPRAGFDPSQVLQLVGGAIRRVELDVE